MHSKQCWLQITFYIKLLFYADMMVANIVCLCLTGHGFFRTFPVPFKSSHGSRSLLESWSRNSPTFYGTQMFITGHGNMYNYGWMNLSGSVKTRILMSQKYPFSGKVGKAQVCGNKNNKSKWYSWWNYQQIQFEKCFILFCSENFIFVCTVLEAKN